MWYFDEYYWGMHLIWWIIWIFLLIWIFALPFRIPGQRHKHYRGGDALDVLKTRFAKGEIDQKEYEEKKAVLEKK